MITVARARYVRVSARKARQVLDEIRDKPVAEAMAMLRFTPRAAARLIEKVLRSAVANAEHNHQVRDLDTLRIVRATADDGPSMKRVQPRAMGRAFFIHHRTSHLTVGVSDETNGAAALARPPAKRPTVATAPPAPPAPAAAAPRAPARRRPAAAGAKSRAKTKRKE